jgi:hypothetical protein
MLFKKDRAAAGTYLLWMLLFPPVYYILSFTPRYRFPILWVSFIPASFVLSEAAQKIWQRLKSTYAGPDASAQSPAKLIAES